MGPSVAEWVEPGLVRRLEAPLSAMASAVRRARLSVASVANYSVDRRDMQSPFVLFGLIAGAAIFGLYAMSKDSDPPPANIRALRRIYWLPVVLLSALMFAVVNPAEAAGSAFVLLFGAAANAIFRTNFFVIPFADGRTLGPVIKAASTEKPEIEEILNRHQSDSGRHSVRKTRHCRRLPHDRKL
ncbi:hypothetical protein [Gordonia sp. VNK21]|uniref:hypothetical protein n=1 Tax=Gordonia sp. VNK21 TaxID=3382483 RepID=UPI0038D4DDD3